MVIAAVAVVVVDELNSGPLAGKSFPQANALAENRTGLQSGALLANEYGLKQALKVVIGLS